jgi:hypothetical protein
MARDWWETITACRLEKLQASGSAQATDCTTLAFADTGGGQASNISPSRAAQPYSVARAPQESSDSAPNLFLACLNCLFHTNAHIQGHAWPNVRIPRFGGTASATHPPGRRILDPMSKSKGVPGPTPPVFDETRTHTGCPSHTLGVCLRNTLPLRHPCITGMS